MWNQTQCEFKTKPINLFEKQFTWKMWVCDALPQRFTFISFLFFKKTFFIKIFSFEVFITWVVTYSDLSPKKIWVRSPWNESIIWLFSNREFTNGRTLHDFSARLDYLKFLIKLRVKFNVIIQGHTSKVVTTRDNLWATQWPDIKWRNHQKSHPIFSPNR